MLCRSLGKDFLAPRIDRGDEIRDLLGVRAAERVIVEEVERLLQTPPGPSPSQQRELLALRAPS